MNEQLVVKNFGPITDATVDFKRVTVFIGPTGGGKTLAKLAAVFRDVKYHATYKNEAEPLGHYARPSNFREGHQLSWSRGSNKVSIENKTTFLSDELASASSAHIRASSANLINKFAQDFITLQGEALPFEQAQKTELFREKFEEFFRKTLLTNTFAITIAPTKPEYIPSERIIVATLEYSWAGLMRDDIGLPKILLDFANGFSLARKSVQELDIPFLNVRYLHLDGRNFIKIPDLDEPLMLLETASGIQSVTPLLVLLEHLSRNTEQAQSFIIEEPELNLYPTAQQGLLNWLVAKCTTGENDLTLTTHSPYILSSCNLLLEAYKVAQQRPELEAEIAAVVPKECWINPEEFAAYYVADGTVKPITDVRTHLIGSNELDAISGDIADRFYQLLRLQKQKPATA